MAGRLRDLKIDRTIEELEETLSCGSNSPFPILTSLKEQIDELANKIIDHHEASCDKDKTIDTLRANIGKLFEKIYAQRNIIAFLKNAYDHDVDDERAHHRDELAGLCAKKDKDND